MRLVLVHVLVAATWLMVTAYCIVGCFSLRFFVDDLRYLQDFMTVELLYLHSRQAIMKVRELARLHEPHSQLRI